MFSPDRLAILFVPLFFLVLFVIYWVGAYKRRVVEEKRQRKLQRQHSRMAGIPTRIAGSELTCGRCEELAAPIVETGNRYRCGLCGREFVDVKHGL